MGLPNYGLPTSHGYFVEPDPLGVDFTQSVYFLFLKKAPILPEAFILKYSTERKNYL